MKIIKHNLILTTLLLATIIFAAWPASVSGAVAKPLSAQTEEPIISVEELNEPLAADLSAADFEIKIVYHLATVEQEIESELKQGKIVQTLKATFSEDDKNKTVQLNPATIPDEKSKLKPGDKIIVAEHVNQEGTAYFFADRYRLQSIFLILGFFLILATFFARKKGAMAIVGLVVSLFIIIKWIIPPILAGGNPLLISFFGALGIAVTSIYLAHGYSQRTTLALISTLITLVLATGMSLLFVSLASLTGMGSDEAFYLELGMNETINLKGLLLGGIIIGVLGVLDDVTTAQVATVDEIHSANPRLSFLELYRRGTAVGQEHIASLVNTLVLAYVGASLPLLLIFILNKEMPLWIALNNEIVAEEVIRTLVGSSSLIFAVPIATFLAAYFFEGKIPSRNEPD